MHENYKVADSLIGIIRKAGNANENELCSIRKTLLGIVKENGARTFVETTARILKDDFQIEGCNDPRIPLKRIFNISLDELDVGLSTHKYDLPENHPICALSSDHKASLRKLKTLRFTLGRANLNKNTPSEKIKNKLNQAKDYYAELDSHIRKEEEVLFPVLEKSGMQEHPQNLRDEHKKFREFLSKITEILERELAKAPDSAIDEVGKVKEQFIADISNHIFRETYVFYPAAVEFIKEKAQWENIRKGFDRL